MSEARDFRDAAQRVALGCTCIRVRRAARAVTRAYDDALRPVGLTSSQLTLLVLIALMSDEGVTFTDVASAMGVDRTTLSRNVRPLEASALIRVARSASDQRKSLLLLTRAGEQAISSAFAYWDGMQRELEKALGHDELDRVHTGVGRLASILADR